MQPVAGPYAQNLILQGDVYSSKIEIHFCVPVKKDVNSTEAESSLVFALNGAARDVAYTSGSPAMAYTETKRENPADNDVTGIFYRAKDSTTVCRYNNASFYKTDFLVQCLVGGDLTANLTDDNLSIEQDGTDPCQFHVTAKHAAGCPTLELTGFVQFIAKNGWISATILFAFGLTSCFFGGLLFDWVVATLAGLATFTIVAVLLSAVGAFKALGSQGTGGAGAGLIFLAIIAFLAAAAIALFAAWFVKKTDRIAMGVIGGVTGFFLANLAYGLLFAQFKIVWLAYVLFFLGTAGGAYLAFKHEQKIVVQLTAVVGAYSLVRGIIMLTGSDYPNEFTMISQMKSGNFEFPNTFYAWLAFMVVMAIAGTAFQWHKGYEKQVRKQGDLDEHFINKV